MSDGFCVSSSTQKFTYLSLMFSRLSWELKGHTEVWDVLPVSKARCEMCMSVFLPFLKNTTPACFMILWFRKTALQNTWALVDQNNPSMWLCLLQKDKCVLDMNRNMFGDHACLKKVAEKWMSAATALCWLHVPWIYQKAMDKVSCWRKISLCAT